MSVFKAAGGLRFSTADAAREATQHFTVMTKAAEGALGAGPGQDQETQFEQAFAQLAFTYLRDRAPALVQHLVGFQLVDRNDDNTKAVGIFGFRLGNSGQPLWLYAPLFFMNNRIKGQNLLYIKNQNRFVPLTEGRINAVLQHRPTIIGQGAPGTSQQNRTRTPDWRSYATPPRRSKYGAAGGLESSLEKVAKASRAAGMAFKTWFTDSEGPQIVANLAYGDLAEDTITPLTLATKYASACMTLAEMTTRYPQLRDGFSEFYGDDAVVKVAQLWQERLEQAEAKEASVLTATPAKLPTPVKEAVTRITYDRIVLDSSDSSAAVHNDMTDDERARLVRDGYLLRDYRTNDAHSIAYDAVQDISLSVPQETGIYHVLVKDGTLEKMLVVRSPYATHERHSWLTLVRLSSPRAWLNCYPASVYAKTDGSPLRDDYAKFFEALPETHTLRRGGVYMVVTEDGQGSVPFRVVEAMDGEQYRISALDSCSDSPMAEPASHRSYLPGTYGAQESHDARFWNYPEMVKFTDRRQTKFRTQANTLICPNESRVVTLQQPDGEADDTCGCCVAPASAGDLLVLGDVNDLETAIRQKTATLRLWSDGDETRINGEPPLKQADALFVLVRDHAIPEKRAREMLASAVRQKAANFRSVSFFVDYGPGSCFYKQALTEPSMLMPGVSGDNMYMPDFQEQPPSTMLDIPSAPNVIERQSINSPIEGLRAGQQSDFSGYNNDPMTLPDPQLMQYAQQAAQSGQKELFDAAGLQTMLKTMRRNIVDDDDISHLTGAVDRLGKMLFKFYWHNDDFADRFGEADMPELEDSLSNNFEGLDALVLMLEERDLTPSGSSMQMDNESVANN